MVGSYPDVSTSSLQERQKQQKQQAKREAKLRLKIEEAKGDLRKTEQKMAKARLAQELAATRLRALEEEFKNIQSDSSK